MSFDYTFEFEGQTFHGIENLFGIDDHDQKKNFGTIILPIQNKKNKSFVLMNFSSSPLPITLKTREPFFIKTATGSLVEEYTVYLDPFEDHKTLVLATNEGIPIITDELKKIKVNQRPYYSDKVLVTNTGSFIATDTGKIIKPWGASDFIRKVLASDDDSIIINNEGKPIQTI